MTVSIILAAKGREVVSVEPNATLTSVVALLAERRIGAALFWAWTAELSASSRSATSCVRLANEALPRSTIR